MGLKKRPTRKRKKDAEVVVRECVEQLRDALGDFDSLTIEVGRDRTAVVTHVTRTRYPLYKCKTCHDRGYLDPHAHGGNCFPCNNPKCTAVQR